MSENHDCALSSPGVGNTRGPQKKQISPSKHWCFTLNNYSQSDIDAIRSNNKISKYIFQEETGQNGTPHLQGYIEFTKRVRPIGIFENTGFHWEKCRNIKKSILYCQKEETRTGQIYTKRINLEVKLKIITELYKWQQDLVDICIKEPDDRTIHVIYDKHGNKGKTALCKYLIYHHNALCVSGKSNDIKYGIVKYNEIHGYYPKILLIDVPRSNIDYINYEAIEKIKDGCFFCGKYESCQVIMNSPHVLLFMNEMPDLHKMSKDRWDIIRLIDSETSVRRT